MVSLLVVFALLCVAGVHVHLLRLLVETMSDLRRVVLGRHRVIVHRLGPSSRIHHEIILLRGVLHQVLGGGARRLIDLFS